jgi:hypothetical protein
MWPEAPLPVPPVAVTRVKPLAPGSRVVVLSREADSASNPGTLQKLPDEAYLRELAELDLGNTGDILAFANAWGWIGDPRFRLEDEDLDPFTGDFVPHVVARFDALAETGALQPEFGLAIGDELQDVMLDWEGLLAGELRHLDEFVLYASVLRDLTKVAQALLGARSWGEVVGLWETPRDWLAPHKSGRAIEDRVDFLCRVLNRALVPFTPRLTLHRDESNGSVATPGWQATTYEALSLQLANHVATASIYKTCQNERCGRYFVHQRGTARHGRSDDVVVYCSPECARAQAQRKYRRRQKGLKS